MHDSAVIPVRRSQLPAAPTERILIGRGRSGRVYLDRSNPGFPVAAKAFTGDRLADLVHVIASGAPNPYGWCEDAVWAAFWRRRLVADLVHYWLPDELEVAEPVAVAWNPEYRVWELHARFVNAYPTALHHPFSAARDGEQRELARTVMRPLQHHLRAAGFDGLAWQAGLGNPVAANNFLVSERRTRRQSNTPRWTWIDLESGVPALFPANPARLLTFYLPRSLRNRRALFDDVDLERLHAYLHQRRPSIAAVLGTAAPDRLLHGAGELARHQRLWYALGRVQSGVEAARSSGEIDHEQARRYLQSPVQWQAHQMVRMASGAATDLLTGARRIVRGARAWMRPHALLLVSRFLGSQRFRARVARLYALRRIRYWRRRRQLSRREAAWLRRAAAHEDHATYLADFAVHLAIKPFYKAAALLGLPVLVQAGFLPLWAMASGMLLVGPVCRSLYTGGRVVQSLIRRRPAPWVAFQVGLIPILGTAAFPAQILRSSRGHHGKLAGLIVYDLFTAAGRKIPIWGGADTATEHLFNRLPDHLVGDRQPLVVDTGSPRT